MGQSTCSNFLNCGQSRADAQGAKATLETTEEEVKQMKQRASNQIQPSQPVMQVQQQEIGHGQPVMNHGQSCEQAANSGSLRGSQRYQQIGSVPQPGGYQQQNSGVPIGMPGYPNPQMQNQQLPPQQQQQNFMIGGNQPQNMHQPQPQIQVQNNLPQAHGYNHLDGVGNQSHGQAGINHQNVNFQIFQNPQIINQASQPLQNFDSQQNAQLAQMNNGNQVFQNPQGPMQMAPQMQAQMIPQMAGQMQPQFQQCPMAGQFQQLAAQLQQNMPIQNNAGMMQAQNLGGPVQMQNQQQIPQQNVNQQQDFNDQFINFLAQMQQFNQLNPNNNGLNPNQVNNPNQGVSSVNAQQAAANNINSNNNNNIGNSQVNAANEPHQQINDEVRSEDRRQLQQISILSISEQANSEQIHNQPIGGQAVSSLSEGAGRHLPQGQGQGANRQLLAIESESSQNSREENQSREGSQNDISIRNSENNGNSPDNMRKRNSLLSRGLGSVNQMMSSVSDCESLDLPQIVHQAADQQPVQGVFRDEQNQKLLIVQEVKEEDGIHQSQNHIKCRGVKLNVRYQEFNDSEGSMVEVNSLSNDNQSIKEENNRPGQNRIQRSLEPIISQQSEEDDAFDEGNRDAQDQAQPNEQLQNNELNCAQSEHDNQLDDEEPKEGEPQQKDVLDKIEEEANVAHQNEGQELQPIPEGQAIVQFEQEESEDMDGQIIRKRAIKGVQVENPARLSKDLFRQVSGESNTADDNIELSEQQRLQQAQQNATVKGIQRGPEEQEVQEAQEAQEVPVVVQNPLISEGSNSDNQQAVSQVNMSSADKQKLMVSKIRKDLFKVDNVIQSDSDDQISNNSRRPQMQNDGSIRVFAQNLGEERSMNKSRQEESKYEEFQSLPNQDDSKEQEDQNDKQSNNEEVESKKFKSPRDSNKESSSKEGQESSCKEGKVQSEKAGEQPSNNLEKKSSEESEEPEIVRKFSGDVQMNKSNSLHKRRIKSDQIANKALIRSNTINLDQKKNNPEIASVFKHLFKRNSICEGSEQLNESFQQFISEFKNGESLRSSSAIEERSQEQSSSSHVSNLSEDQINMNILCQKEAQPDSIFHQIGGQENFDSIMALIEQVLTDEEQFENKDLVERMLRIIIKSRDNLQFLGIVQVIKLIIKGNLGLINFWQAKKDYEEFCITEEEFDQIVQIVRLTIIKSKLVKKIQVLKDIISKISEIRPFIVCQSNDEENEDEEINELSIFNGLGQMLGIQNIMKVTFDNIMNSSLSKYYRGRDLEYLQRRYTMFICSELNDQIMWEDRDLVEIHQQIFAKKNGGADQSPTSKSRCPMNVNSSDFEKWIGCLKQAMTYLQIPLKYKKYFILKMKEQKLEVCQNEVVLKQFTSFMRSEIDKHAQQMFLEKQIDAQLHDEISKYTSENQDSVEAQNFQNRLSILFQKKKLSEFGITDEEMECMLDKTDESIPQALYFIADILQEQIENGNQDLESSEKLKVLFLLYDQEDYRFGGQKSPQDGSEVSNKSDDFENQIKEKCPHQNPSKKQSQKQLENDILEQIKQVQEGKEHGSENHQVEEKQEEEEEDVFGD